jgi:hypothetical protein
MKFRFHKGSLDESMKTCVEVNSEGELARLLDKEGYLSPGIWKIKFSEDHIYDPRIGWDTWNVFVYREWPKFQFVVGMSDANHFNDEDFHKKCQQLANDFYVEWYGIEKLSEDAQNMIKMLIKQIDNK